MNEPQTWSDPARQAAQAASDEEISQEDLIEKLAAAVTRRRLEMPAVLFLEMHRPLSFLGSQALHFFTPLVGMFVPRNSLGAFAQLLDTPEGIERLIDRIEEKSSQR